MVNPPPESAPPGSTVTDPGLVDALVQASFVTMAVLNRVGAENDLSLTQLRVLAILRDRRVGIGGLADYLGLDRSTLTGLVDRAARRGLVQRSPSPHDRRGVEVSLTAAGATLAESVYAQVGRGLAPQLEHLGRPDADRLQVLLERLLRTEESESA